MRKFFKKLMAVGLSLVTLVSGMSISMGSAAAATQNTTSVTFSFETEPNI